MTKLSWAEVEKTIEELAEKIKASDFKPDYMVGITIGGLVPLGLLAKHLNIGRILTVSASSYEKDKKKELNISYLPEINLENQKILLVDEIADTGETLNKIYDAMIEKYKVGEIKTATMGVNKKRCKFWPDFSVIIEEGEWIVFPWEKKEFPEYF